MTRARLEIRVLGPLEVLRDGTPLALPRSRKARALLAYLVATRRPHPRGALCDLLWTDVDDPRAGLRWGLTQIRRVVDDGQERRIRTERGLVRFDPGGACVDLYDVEELLGSEAAASTSALRQVADAFAGEFLDGLELSSCHEYEAWCLGMRERLRSVHASVRDRLVERLRDSPGAALPHALARITLDPLAEEAYVAGIRILGALGRKQRGLELYRLCRRVRSEQLGVGPSRELEAARRGLTRAPAAVEAEGAESADPSADAAAAPPADRPAALDVLPPVTDAEPTLVGRDRELRILGDAVRGGGGADPRQLMLVTGEAGIGKTRLLRELAREVRAEPRGWVLAGRATEPEEVRPYGTWIDMFRPLARAGLPPPIRRELAALLPGLDRDGSPIGERAQLFDGVVRLMQWLADAGRPGLVVLDDVQWLDESSAALLHYVTRRVDESRVAIACAARWEELRPGSSVARLLRALEAAGRLRTVSLDALDFTATAALVSALEPHADVRRVHDASEGNPFFALELLRAQQEGEAGTPAPIEERLAGRLERLDPHSREVVVWAAVLGRAFEVPVLARVAEPAEPSIVGALTTLERRGILRPSGDDRCEFTHALLRQAAYGRLSMPARRAAHRRIADVLDGDTGAARMPAAIASHAELGGVPALAARAYLEAAVHSVWIFAYEAAGDLVERGLAQARQLPDDERVPLEMRLLRVYTWLSMKRIRPADLEARLARLTEEARDAGLAEVAAQGYFHQAALKYERGDFEGTRQVSVRSAEIGREAEPVAVAHTLADAAICLLLVERDEERARRLVADAEALATEHRLETADLMLARGLLLHRDGHLAEAAEAFEQVVRLCQRHHDRWWQCAALNRRVLIDLERRDAAGAARYAREAERLAERIGDLPEVVFARGLGAVADAMAGSDSPATDELTAIDDALQELRQLDSLWKVAHVQAHAAQLEMRRGRPDAARERASEIRRAAEVLRRPSLLALARRLESDAPAAARPAIRGS